jgi:hypothetical protein
MGLVDAKVTRPGFSDLMPAQGMTSELDLLTNNGWKLNDSLDNAVRQTAKLVADVPGG